MQAGVRCEKVQAGTSGQEGCEQVQTSKEVMQRHKGAQRVQAGTSGCERYKQLLVGVKGASSKMFMSTGESRCKGHGKAQEGARGHKDHKQA